MTQRTAVSSPPWLLAALAGGGVLGLLAAINPLLAVGGGVALGYAALATTNVRLGLCLFVVITSFALLPVPLGPTASLTKIAGLVLALSWFASTASGDSAGRGLLDKQPGIVLLIVALLAWVIVTSVWAISPGTVFADGGRYALNALLFLIACAVLRKRRDVVWVIGAFLAGAAISAAWSIVVPPASAGAADLARASGTIGDPNETAAVLVAALPLAIALAAGREWPSALRWLGAATAGLSVAGVLLSASRGGLAALIAVLAVAFVLAGRWRAKLLLVVPAVVLACGGYLLANPTVLQRVTASDGGTGRTDLWAVALRMIEDRPVLGVGAGNFANTSIRYLLRSGALKRSDLIANTPKVAHNTYLTVLAELGLVGALLFASLIAVALGCGWRAVRLFARQRDGPMEMLARAWLIAMAGLLTADAFLSAEFSKQLWLLLALGPAFLAAARSSPGITTAPSAPVRARSRRLASAVRGATRPDASALA